MNSRAAVVDVEPLQAVEILDTLDVAPVAHSYNLYIIGLSKNGGIQY